MEPEGAAAPAEQKEREELGRRVARAGGIELVAARERPHPTVAPHLLQQWERARAAARRREQLRREAEAHRQEREERRRLQNQTREERRQQRAERAIRDFQRDIRAAAKRIAANDPVAQRLQQRAASPGEPEPRDRDRPTRS